VQVPWQFFGTVTFKQARLPERIRISMFFTLLRKLAKRNAIFFPRLIWALRQEGDGRTKHRHFHFLLAGLPQHAIANPTCRFIVDQWQRLGGGMARIALYDYTLNGVKYILKCSEKAIQICGLDSAKFGPRHCELMLSNSLVPMLKARLKGRESSSTPKKV
jgi:hypothetical protein